MYKKTQEFLGNSINVQLFEIKRKKKKRRNQEKRKENVTLNIFLFVK